MGFTVGMDVLYCQCRGARTMWEYTVGMGILQGAQLEWHYIVSMESYS